MARLLSGEDAGELTLYESRPSCRFVTNLHYEVSEADIKVCVW